MRLALLSFVAGLANPMCASGNDRWWRGEERRGTALQRVRQRRRRATRDQKEKGKKGDVERAVPAVLSFLHVCDALAFYWLSRMWGERPLLPLLPSQGPSTCPATPLCHRRAHAISLPGFPTETQDGKARWPGMRERAGGWACGTRSGKLHLHDLLHSRYLRYTVWIILYGP